MSEQAPVPTRADIHAAILNATTPDQATDRVIRLFEHHLSGLATMVELLPPSPIGHWRDAKNAVNRADVLRILGRPAA